VLLRKERKLKASSQSKPLKKEGMAQKEARAIRAATCRLVEAGKKVGLLSSEKNTTSERGFSNNRNSNNNYWG